MQLDPFELELFRRLAELSEHPVSRRHRLNGGHRKPDFPVPTVTKAEQLKARNSLAGFVRRTFYVDTAHSWMGEKEPPHYD